MLFNDAWCQKGHLASYTTVILASSYSLRLIILHIIITFTITFSHLFRNKRDEMKENLRKANKVLQGSTDPDSECYPSIIGKILKINMYVLSTIYKNALLINTRCKDVRNSINKLSTYIQRIQNKDVYEKILQE